jgi:hypothetical protein
MAVVVRKGERPNRSIDSILVDHAGSKSFCRWSFLRPRAIDDGKARDAEHGQKDCPQTVADQPPRGLEAWKSLCSHVH